MFAVEQMDARGRAVAPGASGLLVELAEVEVEMVEHDVARRRAGRCPRRTPTSRRRRAGAPRETAAPTSSRSAFGIFAVIEHRPRYRAPCAGAAPPWRPPAASCSTRCPSRAPRPHRTARSGSRSCLCALRASTTSRFSRTVGSITHASMLRSSTIAAKGVVAGRRRQREDLRRAERRDRRREPRVGRAMPRLVQMVRLVDDDERRRAAAAQRVAMELEELGRREHDVPRAVAQCARRAPRAPRCRSSRWRGSMRSPSGSSVRRSASY